jgi:hypothetical protein
MKPGHHNGAREESLSNRVPTRGYRTAPRPLPSPSWRSLTAFAGRGAEGLRNWTETYRGVQERQARRARGRLAFPTSLTLCRAGRPRLDGAAKDEPWRKKDERENTAK